MKHYTIQQQIEAIRTVTAHALKSKEASIKLLIEAGLIKPSKKQQIMPENKKANRQLDCAVIKYLHQINKTTNAEPYDTVRCPFHEGGHVYPTSAFTERLHIEICVINPSLIKGYFLPRPLEAFNPYL